MCKEEDEQPSKIKIFINNTTLDFEDCEDKAAEVDCKLNFVDGKCKVKLMGKMFSCVNSLSIFMEESKVGDYSVVNKLEIIGEGIGEMHMKDLKKVT